MAKSKSQKQRQSLIRQGKLDPTIMRGSWNGVNPQTKRLPNKKKDAIMKQRDCDYNKLSELLQV